MRHRDLARFIVLREDARIRKEEPGRRVTRKPDSIISAYRFCNVRRNDDRVTKFVLDWLDPEDPYVWFTATVARLFNNEETLLEILPFVNPFKAAPMRRALHDRREAGKKNFNAAYIVSTNGRAMDKVEYIFTHVLEPLWKKRAPITAALQGATLTEAHDLLMRQDGLGSFMAAQVLADIKYIEPRRWSDFHTFAASGPGSKRGLNRVLGRALTDPLRESFFRERLLELRKKVNDHLAEKYGWEEHLTAQDLQNCLCEFDKYERARLGEGTPKQLYKPHRGERP